MKVKAVDIAKELGISKSTVSLALNGKPGVSDITREKIFEIKNRMEQETAAAAPSAPTDMPRIIKLVTFISGTHIAKNSEMDLWTPSFIQVERAVKAMGYSLGVSYFDLQSDNPDDISLIGIDDLPDYAMTETPVSVLSIPYNKRNQLAINMLHEEITNPSDIKFRIYLGYHFIERGSCLPHQMS